jgi:hypothetical protein
VAATTTAPRWTPRPRRKRGWTRPRPSWPEDDLDSAFEGGTESTPLSDATEEDDEGGAERPRDDEDDGGETTTTGS